MSSQLQEVIWVFCISIGLAFVPTEDISCNKRRDGLADWKTLNFSYRRKFRGNKRVGVQI